ncbi:MAG: efflux RND transporter periplasmic adaptor subunit [Planctomycetota bacterium]
MRTGWIALTALVVAACGADDDAGKKGAGAAAVPTVVVAEIRAEDVPVIREFVARTQAVQTIAIQARVEAILQKRLFKEGFPVKKDQVLYELDKRTYEANLSTAEADLAKARADLKLAIEQVSVRAAEAGLTQAKAQLKKFQQDVARLRPLAEQDAVPKQDLDTALAAEEVGDAQVDAAEAQLKNSKISEEVGQMQAAAAVKSAEASVALAQLDLEYCTIRCPIDGLISRTRVHVGNLVGRGDETELATVSQIDPIYATLAISEAEFLDLQATRRKGPSSLEIELILANDELHPHKGKFITAERAVAVETGTLQIVAEFPNPDGLLRDGQFGRVRAAVAKLKGAVLCPQRSVTEIQSAKAVLIVGKDNVVALRTVQLGVRYKQYYVVRKGLEAGDRVIVEGLQKARPGMRVNPADKPVSSEPTKKKN